MLRCMRGNTLKDKVRNQCICKNLDGPPIGVKMRENWLRWHVQQRSISVSIRRSVGS